MSSPGMTSIIRGSAWLYFGSVISNLAGFFYWMIISAVGGVEVVGLTSTTYSLAGLVTGILSLGGEIGVRRFLGVCIGKRDREGVVNYFWSTVLFRIATFTPVGLVMVILGLLGVSIGSLTADMLFYAGIIVVLNTTLVFDELLISHLNTRPIFIGALIGNAVRLPLGVCLVLVGWGWIGAVIGIITMTPVAFAIKLLPSLKLVGFKLRFKISAVKDVLKAGLASWLPSVMTLLGAQLGVLTLFGVRGALETGLYYVAFAIVSVVVMISQSILGLIMPVLSGLENGRKRTCQRAIKISLVLSTPLAFALFAYPETPLKMLGEEYVEASCMLMLLTLTIPALTISSGVTSLLYAYGAYTTILVKGLVGNLTRIVFYAVLSQIAGGAGIALGYTLGSYVALIAAVVASRKIRFNPGFREVLVAITPPLLLALALRTFNINWFIGIPVILVLTYIVYLKTRLLSREDVRELVYAIAPRKTVDKAYELLKPVVDRLLE